MNDSANNFYEFESFQVDGRRRLLFHLWLHLPEPWRSNEFSAQLRRRGVAVTPAEAFVPGREEPPHAVRICVGAPRTRAQLEKGLAIIRTMLQETPDPCLSIL